jgi:hypothetical protein
LFAERLKKNPLFISGDDDLSPNLGKN